MIMVNLAKSWLTMVPLSRSWQTMIHGTLVKIMARSSVEFLVFGVHENPLLLREVHMIDGTMLIMFLDRQNSENT